MNTVHMNYWFSILSVLVRHLEINYMYKINRHVTSKLIFQTVMDCIVIAAESDKNHCLHQAVIYPNMPTEHI